MTKILFLIAPLIFIGCMETRYISLPCETPSTPRPKHSGDMLKDIREILIYTEILESDLAFCKGER